MPFNKNNSKQLLSNLRSRVILPHPCHYKTFLATAFLTLLACIATAITRSYYHYEGINYMPQALYGYTFCLILICAGFFFLFGRENIAYRASRDILCYFFILLAQCFATYAVQFTPFTPIDHYLLSLDQYLHFDLSTALNQMHHHQIFKKTLEEIYDTIPYQLVYLPIFVIIFGKLEDVYEYFFLLLCTTIIGFIFYYFFPTTAPASMIQNPYFYNVQHDTALKFNQIHQHLTPTTGEGGMISMPSFHAIWAWLCLYLIREWRWLFAILSIINLLLVMSCVLLGWHYLVDILGSALTVLIAHAIYRRLSRKIEIPNVSPVVYA